MGDDFIGRGRGTRVIHMCDQRFSKKYPNRDFPSPGKTPPKPEFCMIFHPSLPLISFFGGHVWSSLKNDP